jgi:hypothetical protein
MESVVDLSGVPDSSRKRRYIMIPFLGYKIQGNHLILPDSTPPNTAKLLL